MEFLNKAARITKEKVQQKRIVHHFTIVPHAQERLFHQAVPLSIHLKDGKSLILVHYQANKI